MAKQALDLSFLTTPYEEIELPSRGLVYKNDDSLNEDNSPRYTANLKKGILHIRPWIAAEEKVIDRLVRGNFYSVIKRLVEDATQENIKAETMTLGDVLYVLYQLRALTYGSKYKVNVTCPFCEKSVDVSLDIYSYETTFLNATETTTTIILPKSGIEVTLRIPLFGDFIESTEEKLSSTYKSGIKVTPSQYLTARCITSMILPNEVKQELTQENFGDIIDKVLPRLPMLDTVALTEELNKFEHGIIKPISVKCPECEKIFSVDALLRDEFFRPSGTRTTTAD